MRSLRKLQKKGDPKFLTPGSDFFGTAQDHKEAPELAWDYDFYLRNKDVDSVHADEARDWPTRNKEANKIILNGHYGATSGSGPDKTNLNAYEGMK